MSILIHRKHDTEGMRSGATYSPCETYRYTLWREWSDLPVINFLMLNPSTATELQNDPTIERCQRRAVRLGYGGIIITNLFALRSTDPRGLKQVDDPIGPGNNAAINRAAVEARMVVCAWGGHGSFRNRAGDVLAMLLRSANVRPKLHALKVTNGSPWHPLYLPYELQPVPFGRKSL